MKKFRTIFSFFMVIVIILVCTTPCLALNSNYLSNKLDYGLIDKLKKIENNENITVSIWFDDIDIKHVKNKLRSKCIDIKSPDIYMKVEELLFGELCDIPAGYLGDYLYYAKEHYKDITVEDFQYISSNYMYDNKQMITFSATENGYYSIRVYREGSSNSSNSVDYSISYSIY